MIYNKLYRKERKKQVTRKNRFFFIGGMQMQECSKYVYADQLDEHDIEKYLNEDLVENGDLFSDQKVYCTRIEKRVDKYTGKREHTFATVEIPYKVGNKTVYKPSIYTFNDYYISNNTDFKWVKFMYNKFGEEYKEDMIDIFFGKK